MNAVGQRGKKAEKVVEALLKAWNTREGFAFHRYPDARAARGALAAQPADFLIAVQPRGALHLEVKETKHEFRLARDKVSQVPVLNKFALAGVPFLVLVHHTETGIWRVVDDQLFRGTTPASWDLRPYPTFASAREALLSTEFFNE